jgi:hypothetical protein
VTSSKGKHPRNAMSKTPRDIIRDNNVKALKQAGFAVVRLSELSKLRAKLKSVINMLSTETSRKYRG